VRQWFWVHHLLRLQRAASTQGHMLARELMPVVTVAREPTLEHTVLASTVEQQLQLLLVNY
jgi:hypothetical protein